MTVHFTQDVYDQQTVPTLYYYNACDGTETVSQSTTVIMENRAHTYRDPEHRTKPDNLIDHMTNQEKVYRRHSSTGVLKAYPTGPWLTGGGCPGKNIRYGRYLYTSPGQKYYEADMPSFNDWATDIRLRIKDEQINLGTTLAEYRQSVNMFGSAARGIANAWKLFRGKHRRRKSLTTCSVAAAELVYSFGVSPLVSDVYDTVEALRLRLNHPVYRRYFTQDKKFIQFEDQPAGTSAFKYKRTGSARYSQQVTAYVEFDLEKAALITSGFQNPLSIGWELVPYSFVIDWMIPVGDYLASLDALRATSDIDVAVVRKFKYGHRAFGWYDKTGYQAFGGTPNLCKYESHERVIYNTIPLPALPRWSPSKSYRSLLNALSLLVQTRGCKGRTPTTPLR